jgi:hypothetical protein
VAADPADEPARFSRPAIILGAAAIAAPAAALASLGQTWPLLDVLIPYPFLALVGAVLISEIAARLRRAAPDTHVGEKLVRTWWTSRLAFLVADAFLLATSAVAALAGVPVAATLFEAFILVTMLSATIIMAAQSAINVIRAARGPAGAES